MADEVKSSEYIVGAIAVELQGAASEQVAEYDNARQTIANEVSQFLQDAGYEDASKAVDCEFDL